MPAKKKYYQTRIISIIRHEQYHQSVSKKMYYQTPAAVEGALAAIHQVAA